MITRFKIFENNDEIEKLLLIDIRKKLLPQHWKTWSNTIEQNLIYNYELFLQPFDMKKAEYMKHVPYSDEYEKFIQKTFYEGTKVEFYNIEGECLKVKIFKAMISSCFVALACYKEDGNFSVAVVDEFKPLTIYRGKRVYTQDDPYGEEDWDINENKSFLDLFKKKITDDLKPIEDGWEFVTVEHRIRDFISGNGGRQLPIGYKLLNFYKSKLIGKRIRIQAIKTDDKYTHLLPYQIKNHDFILANINGDPYELIYCLLDNENNKYIIKKNNTQLIKAQVYQKITHRECDPFGEDDWDINENKSFLDLFKKKITDNLKPVEDGYGFFNIDYKMKKYNDNNTNIKLYNLPIGFLLLQFYREELIGKRIRIHAIKNDDKYVKIHDFILTDIGGKPYLLDYWLLDDENNRYLIKRNNTPLIKTQVYQKITYRECDPFGEDDWDE